MAFDLLDLKWGVAPHGYEVVKGERRPRSRAAGAKQSELLPFVTRRMQQRGLPRDKLVKPLEGPKPLFEAFARLSSPEDIVDFANRFGLLGGSYRESILVKRTSAEGRSTSVVVGESISAWIAEINAARKLIEVWKHAKARRRREALACLRQHYRSAAMKAVDDKHGRDLLMNLEWPSPGVWLRSQDVLRKLEDLGDDDDPIPIAMDHIVGTINLRLPPGVNARLAWTREGQRIPQIRMFLDPTSLHQAIWLELAAAVRGWKTYDECNYCHDLYEVPIRKIGRPHSYCSDACKMMAYRMRQAEARRLREGGMPIDEIARRLQVKEKSIKAWTAGAGHG